MIFTRSHKDFSARGSYLYETNTVQNKKVFIATYTYEFQEQNHLSMFTAFLNYSTLACTKENFTFNLNLINHVF